MPVSALPQLSEADYETIAAAVMETSRGRWFLAEFARRNRHADTGMLLLSLQRLEKVVAGHVAQPADGMRAALADMARAIERTKSQIAAAQPAPEKGRSEGYEFESIVQAAEQATSDILAAAEQIQDVAWIMREQGIAAEQCEALEAGATDIYSACAAQDLVAQRMRKAAQTLRFLEGRVNTMLAMYGNTTSESSSRISGREEDDAADPRQSDLFTAAAASVAAAPMPSRGRTLGKESLSADGPLAPLQALSPEETIALFS